MNPRARAMGDLEVWDEELIAHTATIKGRSVEVRAIIQATDKDGHNWIGNRVFRMRLKKYVKPEALSNAQGEGE